jgi:hypothetical protein
MGFCPAYNKIEEKVEKQKASFKGKPKGRKNKKQKLWKQK